MNKLIASFMVVLAIGSTASASNANVKALTGTWTLAAEDGAVDPTSRPGFCRFGSSSCKREKQSPVR